MTNYISLLNTWIRTFSHKSEFVKAFCLSLRVFSLRVSSWNFGSYLEATSSGDSSLDLLEISPWRHPLPFLNPFSISSSFVLSQTMGIGGFSIEWWRLGKFASNGDLACIMWYQELWFHLQLSLHLGIPKFLTLILFIFMCLGWISCVCWISICFSVNWCSSLCSCVV